MPELDRNQIIKDFLKTSEGKKKLADVVKVMMREEMDKFALARHLLQNHQLAPGQVSIYNTSSRESFYVDDNMQIVSHIQQKKIAVPLFEVSTVIQIPFTRLKENDVASVIERYCKEGAKNFIQYENEILFGLINTCCRNIRASNFKFSLLEAEQTLNEDNLKIKNVIVNNSFKTELQMVQSNVGNPEFNIFTSEHCKDHEIYILSDAQHVGMIPEREELTCHCSDDPSARTIGWSIYEQVGMAITNPKSIIKVDVEHSIKYQELLSQKNKYRFISLG